MKKLYSSLVLGMFIVSGALSAQDSGFVVPQDASEELKAALQPQPDQGDRLISDQPEEVQQIMREQRAAQSNRPLAPVPMATKKKLFNQLAAVSGLSIRDLFNFMTSKKKAAEGVTFDDAIEAMLLKANEVNFKNVGHNKFWKDASAVTGYPALRVEILQFCDAVVGRRMLDFSPEFSIFIPCRITILEDATGDIWLMTLDWDVSWLSTAWHPDSELSDQLQEDALRIRDSMEQIMHAGANAEW